MNMYMYNMYMYVASTLVCPDVIRCGACEVLGHRTGSGDMALQLFRSHTVCKLDSV